MNFFKKGTYTMSIKTIERCEKMLEKKNIPVSAKRQITIPQKFFKALDLESEVECSFTGKEIIIRPVQVETGCFAQEILNDLVDKGFAGEELKREFSRLNTAVRPAVKRMLEDAKNFAEKNMNNYIDKTDEIFGEED